MIPALTQLGDHIETHWRRANYNEAVFPKLSADILAEFDEPSCIGPGEVLGAVLGDGALPKQEDIQSTFSNLPVTVYRAPRFHIGILNWLDGTTSIHQHSFSGAFQVLEGSSIHGSYGFDLHTAVNDHLLVGNIRLCDVELLRKGDIRPIPAGNRFIHALFHLDRPSTTLIVRTYDEPAKKPQYTYAKPGIAFDPFFMNDTTIRQVQTIAYMLDSRHPECVARIEEFLGRADFQSALYVIEKAAIGLRQDAMTAAFGLSRPHDAVERLISAVRVRHGSLADHIEPFLKEHERLGNIAMRRHIITDPEHRFFLALLLNVPTRIQSLDLVRRRYPDDDPVETVVNWVETLTATKQFGSREANVLGIANFDDQALFVFECLLQGKSEPEIAETVDAQYPPALAEEIRSNVPTIAVNLRQSILAPLLN